MIGEYAHLHMKENLQPGGIQESINMLGLPAPTQSRWGAGGGGHQEIIDLKKIIIQCMKLLHMELEIS